MGTSRILFYRSQSVYPVRISNLPPHGESCRRKLTFRGGYKFATAISAQSVFRLGFACAMQFYWAQFVYDFGLRCPPRFRDSRLQSRQRKSNQPQRREARNRSRSRRSPRHRKNRIIGRRSLFWVPEFAFWYGDALPIETPRPPPTNYHPRRPSSTQVRANMRRLNS